VSTEKTPRRSTTAAEAAALLEMDPEFQRRRADREAVLAERGKILSDAEKPIVADLRNAGCEVTSVWDLVNTSVPYPQALPILFAHLERGGYPDRVMESLGRALAVRPASIYWQRFRELHQRALGEDENDGLAVAMAASATAEHLAAMVDIVGDPSWGEDRIYLLRAILRVGGLQGREFVEALTSDEVLGKEASALTKKKHPR
jgi:hypothetical protein